MISVEGEKKMHAGVRVFVGLSVLLLVSAAGAQQNATKPPSGQVQVRSGASGGVAQTAGEDSNYVIGPQDVLDISVWKEPDLTRSIPVRPDGKISMPLLNDVQAAGLTPVQLAGQITEGLKSFVNGPQVTVIVTQINSRRIYILGEVSRPGAYPLLPQMTILQALSSAGGFSMFASVKNIYLLRTDNGKQQKYPFNYKDALAGKHPEQNVLLKPADTIVVP